jgi:REP element-mobilizing transposase RayT
MVRHARITYHDPRQVSVAHVFNRTTRRSYLHGIDPLTGADHSHRRDYFRDRMRFLAKYFCIEVFAYAIMSNHWHTVLCNRPDQVDELTDEEVAIRWLRITKNVNKKGKPRPAALAAILRDPERVEELRLRLSNISWFVRLMCQTVARRCNIEDECTGRFFEERFKLEPLKDESDVLACMAYVDLNPLKAHMTDELDAAGMQVSIGERLRDLDDDQVDSSSWLAPLEQKSEVDGKPVVVANEASPEEVEANRRELRESLGCIPMRLEDYTALLVQLALEARPELQGSLNLPVEQLRKAPRFAGRDMNPSELQARLDELADRCQSKLGQHASREVREIIEAKKIASEASSADVS